MAIRQTANLPGSLKSTDRIPPTAAVLRGIEETFGPSSSGNPMITRKYEVVIPETIQVNGIIKVLAGTKLTQYLPTMNLVNGNRDDAKSDKALARLRDENKAVGFPHDVIDDENPELHLDAAIKSGQPVYVDARLDSDEYDVTEPPTPEELAQGIRRGKTKVGEDGKPMKGYRPKLVAILGRATPVAGQTW